MLIRLAGGACSHICTALQQRFYEMVPLRPLEALNVARVGVPRADANADALRPLSVAPGRVDAF